MLIAKPSVYIIVPIHNRKEVTLKCMNSLEQCNLGKQYRIVVVDDGCTDGSKDLIVKRFPKVIILQGNGSLWWTGAIKMGMQYAYTCGCKIIIWLNDDCLVRKATLEKMVDFIECNPFTILGGVGYESTPPYVLSFGGKRRRFMKYEMISQNKKGIFPCDLLSGNLVCMSAKVVEDIGYPDPEKCPHYGGDSLFLTQAKKAGYSMFLDTREPAQNIALTNTSDMNSAQWLLGDKPVREIFGLIFVDQSIISWKVWWFLFTENYGTLGVLKFLFKMMQITSILIVISLLRPLPLSVRKTISRTKRELLGRGLNG